MDAKTYVKNVLITEARDFTPVKERLSDITNIRLLHACAGISSEIAELVQLSEKSDLLLFKGGSLDRINLMEECGDILWYVGIASDALNAVEQITKVDYVGSTCEYDDDLIAMIDSAVLRLTLHSGLLVDRAVKKHIFYGKAVDNAPMIEELAQIHSLVNHLLNQAGFTVEDARERNIAKLKARYGVKFTEAAASERDLENERRVLEERTQSLVNEGLLVPGTDGGYVLAGSPKASQENK